MRVSVAVVVVVAVVVAVVVVVVGVDVKNLTKKNNSQRTHEIPIRHRGWILTINTYLSK